MIDATRPPDESLVANVRAWIADCRVLPSNRAAALRLTLDVNGHRETLIVTARVVYSQVSGAALVETGFAHTVTWDAETPWSLEAATMCDVGGRTLMDRATAEEGR